MSLEQSSTAIETTIEVGPEFTPSTSKVKPTFNLPPPKHGSRKRPFPRKDLKHNTTNGKRSKASFDKSEVAKHVAFTTAIYSAFEIESSFRGLLDLCQIYYAFLINLDPKIANLLSAEHFQYVVLLSSIYRCLLTAMNSTTTIIRNLEYLRETVEKILLPDILCQYVETFGYIKLSTDITVIPYIRSYETMKDDILFLNPLSILRRMGKENPHTDWAIDDDVILEYKQAISRADKKVNQLRLVNFTELEAKPEFLGCYEDEPDGRTKPLAFEQMNATQCDYGAAMKFRDVSRMDMWHGIKPPIIHESRSIKRDSFITTLISLYLKGIAK